MVAGFGRNAEDEHVASRSEPESEQHRRQRRTGASSGRRPGWWGRSTGAPGQLEDRLPCLGGGHSEAFWDVWNLNHLISISILVGFLGTTFGVWFFVELFSVVFPNFSVVAFMVVISVTLRLFECVALKWDRPIHPETPARGEMSSILQAVQANYNVEVDEFERQSSRDPCLKQPAN